jgi:hypothetical protein
MMKRGDQRQPSAQRDAPIDPAVAAVLTGMALAMRARLTELRALILETAAQTGVGPLVETLKWGEPAYRPKAPRTGTTVRMNAVKNSDADCALFFHCQTSLVETFRTLYPSLRCEGNRAILLGIRLPLPRDALAHCIALAFTYHRSQQPRTQDVRISRAV